MQLSIELPELSIDLTRNSRCQGFEQSRDGRLSDGNYAT